VDRPFVESLRIQDFGCIRDATLALTPLHALIGPNDSGKSTVLRAFKAIASVVKTGALPTPRPVLPRFEIRAGGIAQSVEWAARFGSWQWSDRTDISIGLYGRADLVPAYASVGSLRPDPDLIRQPANLTTADFATIVLDERGAGLASVYDTLLSQRRDAFDAIQADVRRLFPSVKWLILRNATSAQKTFGVELTDGTVVPAAELSEGLLYWLVFAVQRYLRATPILLVEEPENGLHPARIADVMKILREISQHTQVLIATHSPLVINELKPDEVTILTRTAERGTVATPLVQTQRFAERERVYQLGELWLSYADGDQESALVGQADAERT
jgi:predicted ATPase